AAHIFPSPRPFRSPGGVGLVLTVAPSGAPEKGWRREEMASWAATQAGGGAGAGAGAGTPVDFEPDFARAVEAVQEGAVSVLVTGSFHTVGDALARLPGFAPVG